MMEDVTGGKVKTECQFLEKVWIETEDHEKLPSLLREHVAHCEVCREKMAHEVLLLDSLHSMKQFENPELSGEILSRIRKKRNLAGFLTPLPPLLSLLILGAGILCWGGVPGAQLLSRLPQRGVVSAFDILHAFSNSLKAGAQAATAASDLLPGLLGIWAALAAIGGLAATTGLYRRWKHSWTLHS